MCCYFILHRITTHSLAPQIRHRWTRTTWYNRMSSMVGTNNKNADSGNNNNQKGIPLLIFFMAFPSTPHQSSSTGGWSAEDEAERELIWYGFFFLFLWINLNPSSPYYFICRLPEMSSSLSPRTDCPGLDPHRIERPSVNVPMAFLHIILFGHYRLSLLTLLLNVPHTHSY